MFCLPDIFTGRKSTLRGAWTAANRHVERNLSFAFLGFAALCLVAPLLQTLYPVFGTIVAPLEERRAASPLPPLRLLFGTNGDFATGLNAWFDDRVGFRDLFIRAKNQIDYTLFDTSKKVWIGSDGWLFRRHDSQNIADLDAAQLAGLEDGFVTLARRLQDKGVHLLVVSYPDKSAIYPEMAPPHMPIPPTGGNNGRLRQFLAGRSEFAFIDTEEIMKREKARSPEHLYYKTDVHVTEVAQLPVVKEIVARIAQTENRPDIHWDEKLTLRHTLWDYGSWARFMSLLTLPAEEAPYYVGGHTIGATEPDGRWNIPDPGVLQRADAGIGRPFDWEFRSLPELCAARLPGMVLFGNSFSDLYWALGLQRYFCFIRRARDPVSRFKLFYDTMPAGAKYFIFEYYEPWLANEAALFEQLFPAN
jgi:SGNH hydrolase-like domain, acetyltransferase AlgX